MTPEARDPYTLSADEAAAALAGAPWPRLAVLGDSFAAGICDPTPGYRDVTWADRLTEALRRVLPQLEYLNTGERGARTADVFDRQLRPVLCFRPDLVVLICGGNDMLTPDYSPHELRGRLDKLLGPLCAIGADVVMYTMMDITTAYPELGDTLRDAIDGLNKVIRQVAADHGAILVELWGHPCQSDKDMYSKDLIHGTWRGQAIMAAMTVQRLAEYLREPGRSRRP